MLEYGKAFVLMMLFHPKARGDDQYSHRKKDILRELKRVGFKEIVAVEYLPLEDDWYKVVGSIKRAVILAKKV